jgi:hypothetical protein
MAGIDIPDSWMGKPIDGALERILAKKQTPAAPQPIVSPIAAGKMPSKYISIPGHNMYIAPEVTHRNKDMFETLDVLASEGQFMPSPAQFMAHWNNVRLAAQGLNALVYSDGTTVTDADAKELWEFMSSTNRQNRETAWTWLNAQFVEDKGLWYMRTNNKVATDPSGKKYLQGPPLNPVISPIRKDLYVELDFDSQGLPKTESPLKQYKQSENIMFWYPRNGGVARFGAGSVGAYLICDRDPSLRDSVLGVFACAAGNAPQNSGGSP